MERVTRSTHLAAVAALALTLSGGAAATTIPITTTVDEFSPGNGNCSLREALFATNFNVAIDACPAGEAAPVVDRIVLAAGEYVLTLDGEDDGGLVGDLDVLDALELAGDPGADVTIAYGTDQRVVHVLDTDGVELSNLTIAGWLAVTDGAVVELDGASVQSAAVATGGQLALAGMTLDAVDVRSSATLWLDDVTVDGTTYLASGGTLDAVDSRFGNVGFAGFPIHGVLRLDRSRVVGTLRTGVATLEVQRSVVEGGGAELGVDTEATFTDTRFENNPGYAIRTEGETTLVRCAVTGNGDGISHDGAGNPLTVVDTLVANNAGTGIASSTARTQIVGTTIRDNGGWGVLNTGGHGSTERRMRIENSTISANAAGQVRNHLILPVELSGLPVVELVHATIVPAAGSPEPAVHVRSWRYFDLVFPGLESTGSLIVGDCDVDFGVSSGGNLGSPGGDCHLDQPSDQVEIADPGIAPLADNGGLTPTHALVEGSPAIDAALAASCPAVDQRGAIRPAGDGCDVGAYERGGATGCSSVGGGSALAAIPGLFVIAVVRRRRA